MWNPLLRRRLEQEACRFAVSATMVNGVKAGSFRQVVGSTPCNWSGPFFVFALRRTFEVRITDLSGGAFEEAFRPSCVRGVFFYSDVDMYPRALRQHWGLIQNNAILLKAAVAFKFHAGGHGGYPLSVQNTPRSSKTLLSASNYAC